MALGLGRKACARHSTAKRRSVARRNAAVRSKKATAIGGQRIARSVLNVIRLWPGRRARSMLPGRPWHRQLTTCTPSPLHHFLPSFRPHTNSRVTLSLACEHRICHGRCVRGFAVNSKRKCAFRGWIIIIPCVPKRRPTPFYCLNNSVNN